ncbi:HlyD family efflux transporter periplasmic adaptor subunit [Burkholderia multivorans]|uniref:HlyD family secretion protein n=1 Tax=Burkholderia multivorans TaxID=87883 RepID=UPI001C23B8A9|nr:HlyD family efflux transporter periplasmic adaptor subunit [Burkholderia multivorans]MBU9151784.1 HlyD family efflux transporter periplasmic adaptor subunit [Burkholderia multivorans]MBU9484761.1 HlyD family efflux transporter periplasmic adaptor subunit [Burkholderia multivorans]MBY4674041.1 HlyD family efflux transporter periplasmic adaptor subunit [Burkholderia multivorans]
MMPGSRSPLFRKEAQDAQRATVFGSIVLAGPVSFATATAVAICIALGVILLFMFGSYTRRTTVTGVVVPNTGLVKIYAPQPGIVLVRHVTEGQHVEKGHSMFVVSRELHSAANGQTHAALIASAHQRKIALQHEIDKVRILHRSELDRLHARIADLRAELGRIDVQLASQERRTHLAVDATLRYDRLLANDFISKDEAQQRHADLFDQQSRLQGLKRERAASALALNDAINELSGLGPKHQNQVSQMRRSVIDVDQTVIESEAQREFIVTAPESGTVAAVLTEPGQTADGSRPLASIVPDGAHWQAHLFVPSEAIGFIRTDDSVLIRYQAYPYQKFGQYAAKVVSIARSALSAAELSNSGAPPEIMGSFYRVTVALKEQDVTAYGASQKLQAGMSLHADVFRERRRLYEWVLEPLYSMTGKL